MGHNAVEPFRVGIAGLGTVGAGVVDVLHKNGKLLTQRAGRPIEIVAVSACDRRKNRGVDLSRYEWVDDPRSFSGRNDLDAVVELIGGSEGIAKSIVHDCLTRGRSVVTANKALLALHGYDLALLAERNGAALMYEAAVAGGVPVIKALREGYAANRFTAVYGILNGTCNYILTEMRETGRDFSSILKEAQEKGYAEADPSFDVDGIDAAHKLCILTALTFGVRPEFGALRIRGIRDVTAQDIAHAGELGFRIKLLGVARKLETGAIVQAVEPCLVPVDSPMGAVEGVFNAVFAEGDCAGTGLLVGRGAGAGPTASAVVADLIDLARGRTPPVFGIPANDMAEAGWAGTGHLEARFYLHLVVLDRPGVLADISGVMREHNVSMESVIQRARDPGKPVSIIITSHKVRQADMEKAVAKITALPTMAGKPCLLRIESF